MMSGDRAERPTANDALRADAIPLIVSTDDHVVEPSGIWQDRLPAELRATGPRVVRQGIANLRRVAGKHVFDVDDDGQPCDWWYYEDLRRPITREFVAAGEAQDEDLLQGVTFDEMQPAFYRPLDRLDAMDVNGVEASLCFPNILPRFCGQTFLEAKDKDLALLCVKAYNDWVVDEWSGPSAGRLIPVVLVPLWDSELAAAEIYRNADRGVHAVTFTELPNNLGLPSIHNVDHYWDPFLRACNDTATTVCLHIGSSSRTPTTSPDAPMVVSAMLMAVNAMSSMSDWLFSGTFERFPELTVSYSEGNIGWIPYILERADRAWESQLWMYDRASVPRPPSEYYAEHIFGCYISDSHGLASLEAVGEDNVTFETDYPHTDGTWPHSRQVAAKELAALSPIQIEKIVRGNAIRMLGLAL